MKRMPNRTLSCGIASPVSKASLTMHDPDNRMMSHGSVESLLERTKHALI